MTPFDTYEEVTLYLMCGMRDHWASNTTLMVLKATRLLTISLLVGLFLILASIIWRKRMVIYSQYVKHSMDDTIWSRYLAVRDQFTSIPWQPRRPATGHTHARVAAERSHTVEYAHMLASRVGMRTFVVQMSPSDQMRGLAGNRTYYWTKDVVGAVRDDQSSHLDLFVYVDVDYYADMEWELTENVNPTLLYTITPENAGGVSEDRVVHWFDALGKIHMRIPGGASYSHYLWDYGSDTLRVVRTWWGIPWKVATYCVDTRRVSQHRSIVLLTPTGLWTFPATLAAIKLDAVSLRRLDVVRGTHARLSILNDDGYFVSTGLLGEPFSSTIPHELDQTLGVVARTGHDDLNIASIMSNLPKDTSRAVAAGLLEYHRLKRKDTSPVVYPIQHSVRTFEINPVGEDLRPSLRAFMNPLVHGCFAPSLTIANEQAAAKGRIENVRSDKQPSMFIHKCAEEFAALMFPYPTCHPVEIEEVFKRQPRPQQQAILWRAVNMGANIKRALQVFIKKEAYPAPKDPRIISTIHGVDKLHYSRYMYGLMEAVKSAPWYAFSRSNKDTALRVAYLCQETRGHVLVTDFSRFDGHVSPAARHVERIIVLRAFGERYHAELVELMRHQYDLMAYMPLGHSYMSGTARASGSAETSVLNSLLNAFVSYVALRNVNEVGMRLSPQEAYSRLGVYGGDDGLVADIPPEGMKSAARLIGQELTVETVKHGDLGIKFLSRYYGPHVWFGNLDSVCDVPRMIAKFHTCVALPPKVTPERKLSEKLRALSLTDWNTPTDRKSVV